VLDEERLKAAWAVPAGPKPPLKTAVLVLFEDFLHQNGVETERHIGPGGIYRVDLIEKLTEELQPVPDEKVLSSLKDLISQASMLVGAYS